MLKRASEKSRAQHGKHRIHHPFKIGNRVWLHINKQRFSGLHSNLEPLWYGLDTIIEKKWENDFNLNIPPYLGLHLVFNVDLLRFYFPQLLELIELKLIYQEDIHSYVQYPFFIDTIVEQQSCHTRMQKNPSFQVAKEGQLRAQGKWHPLTKLEQKFPHFLRKEMGTITTLWGRYDPF